MIHEIERKSERVVLLADDELLVRNLVSAVLCDAGYRVLDAADGEQALEVSRHYDGSIDFLLTDITMPKMGGIELSRRIARERPGIKVLMMSGVLSTEALVRDQNVHFLRKPFLPEALCEKLSAMLPAG
jgi:CheY-like chemotaxis protein